MALFGKKKKTEPVAPAAQVEDEIMVVGGDADESDEIEDGGGQVIDFDAIADELGDDDGESAMGDPLGDMSATTAATTAPADFDATADFASGNAGLDSGDELDFDAVFDDGSPAETSATAPTAPTTTASGATASGATASGATDLADDNPFGAGLGEADSSNEPLSGGIDIEPVSDTPPLTYTAPLLTSDAVATAGVPATRKSFPLPLLLGALGLLLALGAVGYFVTQSKTTPDETPVVATAPPLRAPAGANLVSLGSVVDGVPIAPGAFQTGQRALSAPQPTVPLTPGLLKQLQDLWKQGAAAKNRKDFAGARAAWTEMLRRRPNHPGVQSAIDKLPAA